MSDEQIGSGIADIKVESNYTAPVEQKSTETTVETKPEPIKEMATTEPKTEVEATVPEPVKEPVVDSNEAARKAIEAELRADAAERRLKELQPKTTVTDKKPDINDKSTWGDKYKDAPNDLDTFLQARDEWAEAQGDKRATERLAQAEQQKQQMAIRTAVTQREQESRAKHSDYDAVINPIVPVIANIPILKDFISRNPMGAEVAYELGKNPVVLQTLMRSDAWTAGEQLLNMAARLKAPKPVEITQAPEPIKPVGSRETVKPRITELATKDINGYMQTMNKRELDKKRRA